MNELYHQIRIYTNLMKLPPAPEGRGFKDNEKKHRLEPEKPLREQIISLVLE